MNNLLFSLFIVSSAIYSDNLIERKYNGFTLQIDCAYKSSVFFKYILNKDLNDFKRSSHYIFDPIISPLCQQSKTTPYKYYERGHLVSANHMDNNQNSIKDSNYIPNIVPQTKELNRGSWLLTEEITECLRELSEITIIGGILFKDIKLTTHNIQIPNLMWKVIYNNRYSIAWLIPNNDQAIKKNLQNYKIPITQLKNKLINEKYFKLIDFNDIPSNEFIVNNLKCDLK